MKENQDVPWEAPQMAENLRKEGTRVNCVLEVWKLLLWEQIPLDQFSLSLFFSLGRAARLVGSEFPDLGLNLGSWQ